MATKEQFNTWVANFQINVWIKSSRELRKEANDVEEYDSVLATIMRRIALDYEQYAERIYAHQELARYDEIDRKADEGDSIIDELFSKIKKQSSQ